MRSICWLHHTGRGYCRYLWRCVLLQYLKREVTRIQKERKELGLEGLVGGLECVITNAELDNQTAAIHHFNKIHSRRIIQISINIMNRAQT